MTKENHLKVLNKELEETNKKLARLELNGGGDISRLRVLTLEKGFLEKSIEVLKLKNKLKWERML